MHYDIDQELYQDLLLLGFTPQSNPELFETIE